MTTDKLTKKIDEIRYAIAKEKKGSPFSTWRDFLDAECLKLEKQGYKLNM